MHTHDPRATSSGPAERTLDSLGYTGFTLSASVALVTTGLSVATVYLVLSRPLDLADAMVEPRWSQVLSALAGLVVSVVRDLIGYL